MPPRQARVDIQNLMDSGYKLMWISSYRVGPSMTPFFDFVASNDSAVDTLSQVEISFAVLNQSIYTMQERGYFIKLLIDRIRGKNPSEPTYSVIFEKRDEIFETQVFLRDSFSTYNTRLGRMASDGFRLISHSFCSIRGNIEVSSVFIRDRRIPFNIPTPTYPRWLTNSNLTFFEFTDATLREARNSFIPFAVEVYRYGKGTQSLFTVLFEDRTEETEGNWFRWSLNTTQVRELVKEQTRNTWDIYLTTGYTHSGKTEHFVEFTRKKRHG